MLYVEPVRKYRHLLYFGCQPEERKTIKRGSYAFWCKNHCDSDSESSLSGHCCRLWRQVYSDVWPLVWSLCATPLKIQELTFNDNNYLEFIYWKLGLGKTLTRIPSSQRCCYNAQLFGCTVNGVSCCGIATMRLDYSGDIVVFWWILVRFVI